MKMKKIFAAMAATAVSAASFAAMAIPSASAADVVGIAGIRGQAGPYTYWGEDDNTGNVTVKDAEIDGNAQYEAVWDITGDGTGSIEFLMLEIKETDTLGNAFTADTFPDLTLTVDEIYIDGEQFDFTQNDDAITLKYYESETKRGTRAYFTNTFFDTDKTLGVPTDKAITSRVKVVFTVGGLYNEGTSNVTQDPDPTEPPTDEPTDPVVTTTTAAADGGDTTTTTTAKDGDTTTTTAKGNGSSGTTTTAKKGGSNGTTTTAKAASNGGKSETSAATGDAGVGVAAAALVLAGTAAIAVRKRK